MVKPSWRKEIGQRARYSCQRLSSTIGFWKRVVYSSYTHNLWRRDNHIIFVGFQVRATPGLLLIDGAKRINILSEEIVVKAHIHTLGGFSVHAGQSRLLEWAGHFKNQTRLDLVHCELDKMLVLLIASCRKT